MALKKEENPINYYDQVLFPNNGVNTISSLGIDQPPTEEIAYFQQFIDSHPDVKLPNRRGMEIGFGLGRNLRPILNITRDGQRIFDTVHGIEGSPYAVRKVKEELANFPEKDNFILQEGNIHQSYPWQESAVIFDNLVGFPESPTQPHLKKYIKNMYNGLALGGLAIVSAITTDDIAARKFLPGPYEKTIWWKDKEENKKIERLTSPDEMRDEYIKAGFNIVNEEAVVTPPQDYFGEISERRYTRMILQKPG